MCHTDNVNLKGLHLLIQFIAIRQCQSSVGLFMQKPLSMLQCLDTYLDIFVCLLLELHACMHRAIFSLNAQITKFAG